MTEAETKAYLEFMWDPANAYQCDRCPENRGEHSSIERKQPCGQQNCWVVCHWKHQQGVKA